MLFLGVFSVFWLHTGVSRVFWFFLVLSAQLARHIWRAPMNWVNTIQKSYLRGLQYKNEKAKVSNPAGKNQHNDEVGAKSLPQPKTAERLAEQHKVSHQTIKNDEHFADSIKSPSWY